MGWSISWPPHAPAPAPASMIIVLGCVVCLGCLDQARSLSYQGHECTGLVQFDLLNTSNVLSLDGHVAVDLSSFPVYISYPCKGALRRYFCLSTYIPEASASLAMCSSVCSQVLDTCKAFLDAAVKETESSLGLFLYNLFQLCAEEQPQTSCANGSAGPYFAQDEPLCFYQTVVADEHGASFALEPSACALPCPGGIFHPLFPLWHKLMLVLTIVSVIAASTTTYTFSKKYWQQRKQRSRIGAGINSLRSSSVFPVLMFCVGGLIQSVVNCAALISEVSEPTCDGNAKWHPTSSMCYVQSVTILGSGLWSSCWSFVIAFEACSIVFSPFNFETRHRMRAWYAPAAIAATLVPVTVIHLELGGIGMFSVPFCAPSSASLGTYSVSLINEVSAIPAAVLVSLSSIMLIAVMFQVRKIDCNSSRASVGGEQTIDPHVCCSWPMSLRSVQTHLLRILLLVLCYNFVVLFSSSLSVSQQINESKYKSNAAAYYACLFTYSTEDPDVGRERCGDAWKWNVSLPLWVFPVYVSVIGCYGLIPFLVFGLDYNFSNYGMWLRIIVCCRALGLMDVGEPRDHSSSSKARRVAPPLSPDEPVVHLATPLPSLSSEVSAVVADTPALET